MTPKDFIVYIDPAGVTRAVVAGTVPKPIKLVEEGSTIIGFISSGCETDAIKYGDEVLRKD